MNPDPHITKTAKALLDLHGGACSVLADSPIGEAFEQLREAGEVTISPSDTAGFVNVRKEGV